MKLNLFTTNACNLNCTYCYEKNKNNLKMSISIGRQVIDFFWGKVKDGIFNINFHGGEPLIEFSLIKDLVQYINEKSRDQEPHFIIDYSLTTNGTLITKEISSFFKENKFNIRLSLDGNQEAQDLHRRTHGNQGTFDKVIQGAKLLKEDHIDFAVRMTVTPDNVHFLVDSVIWLINNNFEKINIVADAFADWDKNFVILTNSFKRIRDIYLEARKEKRIVINLFDGKYSSYMLHNPPLFCNAGSGSFAISTSGLIYPCVYVVDIEEFCIGDLSRGISPLKRKRCIESCLKREDSCGDCTIQGFCHAKKCGFLNYSTTGYLDDPNPFLCKHEKLLYRMISEVFDQLYGWKDHQIIGMLNKLKTFPHIKANEDIEKYLL
ncbi:radical SAM protein [Paenibacillus pseudetheri]|uniref:GTP 3',8-cyclase n=1 Tax=Paenibacillus pseudetheri TaxID=2897682 RepID=A0ABN8FTR3_9BACL|nr:radical SAM protein [Paenibacillus pseudetheri]CAH1059043.1 GTP 3',8-cyclase [Paenibacillus pseudetheri]